MRDLKLSIDLLPRGAWGNDLSNTLAKKDWDSLRNFCYKRFHNRCAICGAQEENLDAHEVWRFDKENQTQTLVDVIALCPKCHGVKHMRNTERIGYGDNAKRHFCNVNNCSEMDFAGHYAEQQLIFEDLNEVLRWKVVADLSKVGGNGIEVVQRMLPIISNPYNNVDWQNNSVNSVKRTTAGETFAEFTPQPKIRCIDVDNYSGQITIIADNTDKIQMVANDVVLKTKYNLCGRFVAQFSVENLRCKKISFSLIGKESALYTKNFVLTVAL